MEHVNSTNLLYQAEDNLVEYLENNNYNIPIYNANSEIDYNLEDNYDILYYDMTFSFLNTDITQNDIGSTRIQTTLTYINNDKRELLEKAQYLLTYIKNGLISLNNYNMSLDSGSLQILPGIFQHNNYRVPAMTYTFNFIVK